MSSWEDGLRKTTTGRQNISRRNTPMKTLMSVMLGLSLLVGFATVSFAQDDKKTEGKKKGKKKSTDDEKK
jgi:hypothetical protein